MSKGKNRASEQLAQDNSGVSTFDQAANQSEPNASGPETTNGPAPAAPAKPVESKAQRFRRLANQRIPKALKVLGNIENLTRKQSYEYTPEQADRIVTVLAAAVKRIVDGFSGQDAKPGGFIL